MKKTRGRTLEELQNIISCVPLLLLVYQKLATTMCFQAAHVLGGKTVSVSSKSSEPKDIHAPES